MADNNIPNPDEIMVDYMEEVVADNIAHQRGGDQLDDNENATPDNALDIDQPEDHQDEEEEGLNEAIEGAEA